jgi:hypothetical protein
MTQGEWKKRINDGMPIPQLAKMLQSKLKGYRQTSLSRADDLDNIVNLLQAIIEHNKGE